MLPRKQRQALYSDIAWIRIYTGIAMLATTLLGTAREAFGILAADSIIFPSIYLAGAPKAVLKRGPTIPSKEQVIQGFCKEAFLLGLAVIKINSQVP